VKAIKKIPIKPPFPSASTLLFDIQLPASWTNKSVEAEGKGGLIGIFFMAFTLALVSFSCTGPIVGTLLVEASTGGYFGPIIGMLGFSLAIALPFAFFAAFPGWLNSLPQSGVAINNSLSKR
jgi:thiol:disulfide interchange protein DsbD